MYNNRNKVTIIIIIIYTFIVSNILFKLSVKHLIRLDQKLLLVTSFVFDIILIEITELVRNIYHYSPWTWNKNFISVLILFN